MKLLIFLTITYISYIYLTKYFIEEDLYQSKEKFINIKKFHCKRSDSEISCVDTNIITNVNGEIQKEDLYE